MKIQIQRAQRITKQYKYSPQKTQLGISYSLSVETKNKEKILKAAKKRHITCRRTRTRIIVPEMMCARRQRNDTSKGL